MRLYITSRFVIQSFHQMVSQIVENADLTLPWEELKKSFRKLIQTQFFYPHPSPPGIWKTGMHGLKALLQQNSIDDQTECFIKTNPELLSHPVKISVLSASHLSGITPDGRAKIKTDWASIQITKTPNSTHFLLMLESSKGPKLPDLNLNGRSSFLKSLLVKN